MMITATIQCHGEMTFNWEDSMRGKQASHYGIDAKKIIGQLNQKKEACDVEQQPDSVIV